MMQMTENMVLQNPQPSVMVAGSYPPPRSATSTDNYKKLMNQIDQLSNACRTSSWLESMKASSPTHIIEDRDWNRRYPSALSMFDEITEMAKEKKIAVFLDYDGTLSPIVEDPDAAYMTESMRASVKKVAKYFPTAVVTGRSIDKILSFVRLNELYYAGSHGMDIKGPTKSHKYIKAQAKSMLFQPASKFLPIIKEVYSLLSTKTKLIPGCKVENNKFCVSVHFRCVDEKRWSGLIDDVRSVLSSYPTLRLSQGRKVLEIRPTIEWCKGKALEFLLEVLGFNDRDDILPIYIGDDRTDEDAFKALCKRGQGFGILVSKFPKETNATYSVKDPSEVKDFLDRLALWKRHSLKARFMLTK